MVMKIQDDSTSDSRLLSSSSYILPTIGNMPHAQPATCNTNTIISFVKSVICLSFHMTIELLFNLNQLQAFLNKPSLCRHSEHCAWIRSMVRLESRGVSQYGGRHKVSILNAYTIWSALGSAIERFRVGDWHCRALLRSSTLPIPAGLPVQYPKTFYHKWKH